jgi:transglutaminase-like putative cysteine protease
MSEPTTLRAVAAPPPGRTSPRPPGPTGAGNGFGNGSGRDASARANGGGKAARPPDHDRSSEGWSDTGLLLANEVVLTIVTLAAVVGMHRLFIDGSYRGALALQVVVAHAVVALLRRARVGLLLAALVTLVSGAVFITWTRFPDTTQWLLPTGETVRQFGDDLSTAWRIFGDVSAPAPVANGFIVVTAVAIWILAFVADWAAFRVSATLEALLPATTLFVFAAALGGEGSSPIAGAAVFSGAALAWVLIHRTTNQERNSRWAGGRRAHGRWSLVGTGAAIIAAAVLVGAAAGPNLPGADAEAMLAWRDLNDDDPTRVVLSPIVSLQTSLVDQPDVEVFTVRSERPAYWRLTALDEYDGEIWRSSYSTDDANGTLPRAIESAGDGETVSQRFTISALDAPWMPAAFEPVAIDPGDDQPADVDDRSSTLMVDRDVDESDGYTYEVTSRIPDWTTEQLRSASPDVPTEIAERFRQLPGDFPDAARAEAARVTQDEATPYDKALALQQYFRSEFTYDLDVGPGHSEQALLDFLFVSKRGYCEQFAAAFAALARAVDLPSRVAVGFTPGVQDENDLTLFRVRGVHAHAWAEVYLGEYGWVTFDPTPTRGPPGANSWLGISESQDTTGGGAAVTDPDTPSGFGDGSGAPAGGASGDEMRNPGLGLDEGTVAGAAAQADENTSILPEPVRDAARPVGLAALAYLVLVPLAIVAQRMVRRRRATTPAAKARLWWQRLTGDLAASGVALPPSLTIAEKADRMAEALPDAAADIQRLARTMETIVYAEAAPPAGEVADAERAWAAAVAESARRRPWRRRVLRYFDMRQLFGHRVDRRLVAHGAPARAAVNSAT